MAVIQKIRNKYGKIAGGIIAVALVGFIVQDALNGNFGGLFSGRDSQVMTINGTKIDGKEYNLRVKEYETLTTIFGNRGPIDDATRAQISEQVLQSVAYETLVTEICDKLGVQTTKKEEEDLIYGPNAHPLVRQFQYEGQKVFDNPETKQFDPQRVKGIENEIKQNGAKVDPYGKFMEQWNAVKGYIIRNSRIDKFNTMMAAAVYAPMYGAKRAAEEQDQIASIRYVKVPYTYIQDNDAKVTEEDMKAYMQKHKAMFESEQATRTIDYVSFEIVPASADSMRVIQSLEELKSEMSTTKDDKTFAGNKSDDISTFSEAFVNNKTFTSRFADTILAQPVGTIYGPYFENNGFRMTKVVDKKVLPDSAKVRHILIKTKDMGKDIVSDSVAKGRMDSIMAAINSGVLSFDTAVAKLSDDEGSRATNGEYWFNLQQRPGISKEFADFAFEGKAGEKKLVKVDNSKNNGYAGYHYIEILEQRNVGATSKLTTIVKNLVPSDSTSNSIFSRANEFAAKSSNAAEFDANVKKMNLDKRVGDNIKESSFTIQGLGNAREIVKWMYTSKVGDVARTPFLLNNERCVIPKLASANEKGLMPLTASTRPMLEQRIREEKKAEMISKKFKGSNLDAIGVAAGMPVQQSDSVTLGAPYIPSLGYEPKVVGYSFYPAFNPNTVSPGIKGQGGVYFISVISRGVKPTDPAQAQMGAMQQRSNQEMQLRQYIGQMMQPSITKNADIKYNINNF